MHTKVLFKDRIFLYIAISITFIIAFLSLIKLKGQPIIEMDHLDKIEHAFAYAILALSWLLAFKRAFLNKKLKYIIALSCVFYGIVIEVLQTTLTTYRTASLLDILANMFGVIVALLIFSSIYKKIHAI
jgi:VanZ family protein